MKEIMHCDALDVQNTLLQYSRTQKVSVEVNVGCTVLQNCLFLKLTLSLPGFQIDLTYFSFALFIFPNSWVYEPARPKSPIPDPDYFLRNIPSSC